jgi:hypothetical protein
VVQFSRAACDLVWFGPSSVDLVYNVIIVQVGGGLSRMELSRPAKSWNLVSPHRPPSPVVPPTPLGLQGTHNRTFRRPNYLHIGNRWREIQGASSWAGLLDNPLDECLRTELVRYGVFAQVAYDAFDFDKYSQYCGSCRYSKENLFKEVDLHNTGYTVTM